MSIPIKHLCIVLLCFAFLPNFFLDITIKAKSEFCKGVISNNILTFVKTNQKLIFLLICHGQRIENLLHQYR